MNRIRWWRFRALLFGLRLWCHVLIFRCWVLGGDTAGLRVALGDELERLLGERSRERRLAALRGEP